MSQTSEASSTIADAPPELREAYRRCRLIAREHGKSYYLATALLPAARRPAVHALYAFARCADDVVDHPRRGTAPSAELADFGLRFAAVLADLTKADPSQDPVLSAAADTIVRYSIPRSYVTDFLASMTQDLTVTRYATYPDLERYMWGSAAVIGLQMLPVLGTCVPSEVAEPYAVKLAHAFQLTNFIRDIGEDLQRGRIYLPQDAAASFGVDAGRLAHCVRLQRSDAAVRSWVRQEVHRARELYRASRPGIELVSPDARRCLRTAWAVYGAILDEIERRHFEVLAGRVSVALPRRLYLAGRAIPSRTTSR